MTDRWEESREGREERHGNTFVCSNEEKTDEKDKSDDLSKSRQSSQSNETSEPSEMSEPALFTFVDVLAAAMAGFTSTMVTHPIDLVKTRIQTDTSSLSPHSKQKASQSTSLPHSSVAIHSHLDPTKSTRVGGLDEKKKYRKINKIKPTPQRPPKPMGILGHFKALSRQHVSVLFHGIGPRLSTNIPIAIVSLAAYELAMRESQLSKRWLE
eukprot:GHVN01048068.1.p1 GENE.GHVN01048068.1~~GHVN01048068.1.p1  ORF type:complete len:211 (-),score=54.20 GHVN01048068.1:105-737(-)